MTNLNLSAMSSSVIGWDIGGVNTKVARVTSGTVVAARAHPFELQHDPGALTGLLRSLAEQIGASVGDVHAVMVAGGNLIAVADSRGQGAAGGL